MMLHERAGIGLLFQKANVRNRDGHGTAADHQARPANALDVANVRQDVIGEDAQRAHDLFLRQRTEVDQ
jgi:hypothetical protein